MDFRKKRKDLPESRSFCCIGFKKATGSMQIPAAFLGEYMLIFL